MNIGFFIEKFTDIQFRKESGLIIESLKRIGINVQVYCNYAEKKVIDNFNPIIINKKTSNNYEFWKAQKISHLMIYSWLSIKYTNIIKSASKAGIKVFLKMDSDGNLIYPKKPTYIKTIGLNNSFKEQVIYIARLFQWFVIPRIISKIRIQQISLSQAILIESPLAKNNLAKSLSYWHKDDLIKKIYVVENPIRWQEEIPDKQNIILCIGRWDYKQKNTKKLITVMNKLTTNWHVKIIGTEANKVVSKIKNPNLKISFINNIEHTDLLKIISTVKIIFMPSIWEGFPLAACEGVTAGCSIVGGPLPGLIYLTSKNNGIITNNLQTTSLCNALQEDINRWENNYYQPEKIANDWRAVLSPEVKAKKIINLMKES